VIEFHLLGALEAVEDGTPVGLGAPRQRALLAMLLIHRGRTMSADALIDALWGERPPNTALKIVQGYVSNLRRALGESLLTTEGRGYCLRVGPDQTDADRFEQLLSNGRSALGRDEPGTAAATLREALALWSGPALADFADERFAQPEIARLEELRLVALEQRIDAELALGDHARVIGELQGLVRAHPLREAFTGQLMLALYRAGRQADALDCYREARTRLIEELGLEPGPALREREQAILAQDPSLLRATPSGREHPPGPGPSTARTRRGAAILVAALAAVALLVVLAVRALGAHRSSGVQTHPNAVIAIDTHTDRVIGVVGVGARPGAIASGDGSLWVANQDDQTISQVDPRTLAQVKTITLTESPDSIAASNGRIWVAASSAAAPFVAVDRIDPQFDSIDATTRIPSVLAFSNGALAARGQSLWVASDSGELTRMNARTGRVDQRIDPNGGPTSIALAPDGSEWMTDSEGDDVIDVDSAGEINTIPVGHDPTAIAIGDGGIWVTDSGDNRVLRIDPATHAVTGSTRVGATPLGVVVGAGSVWVANSGSGTVSRIDPTSGRVRDTIKVGGSPQDIVVAGSSAWVSDDAPPLNPSPNAQAESGATIREVSSEQVSTMDPAITEDDLAVSVLDNTCADLLNYPDRSLPAGAQLIPEVAQALPTRSDGGRTYTFTIRPGFRFSPPSNAPVTALTFEDTIDRVLNPRTRSPYAGDYLDITGARAFHAGRTPRLTGVTVRGDRLIIRLIAASPSLPARMAAPAMCAVPDDTPVTPRGVNLIPSAGPYRLASFAPGQPIVLTRNPNYHGDRPRHASRIVVQVGIPAGRAIAEVQDGTADYAPGLDFTPAQVAMLQRKYGAGSTTARGGDQRYFQSSGSDQLDFFALNTHRRLFSHLRLRQAVNYAIDRTALAHLGDAFEPLPEHPTSHYLPPGMPGYRNVAVYPDRPDVTRARELARGFAGSTVELGTCDVAPCADQTRILTRDLAAIGLHVRARAMPVGTLAAVQDSPRSPFDMTWNGWLPDYIDPGAFLNVLLATSEAVPSFVSPHWQARLRAVARLAGPQRDIAYGRLDLEIAREAAPLAAFGNLSGHDFYSARVGCERSAGRDLGALCLRHTS
jgi:YVTN family beta-propeller protein